MPSQRVSQAGATMVHASPKNAAPSSHTRGRNEVSKYPADDDDHDAAGSETDVDPDAQTTVTDFLDFTEYLPSDMVRSLTLIGKLDEKYTDASIKLNDLTTTWGQLPSLPADTRPTPVRLRADISDKLGAAVTSRILAHAEAVRMSDNVHRHYNKATVLLSKLQAMIDNYPAEEHRSPTVPRSPQMARFKQAGRGGPDGSHKLRRHRVPKITVPGEVLAPFDIIYDTVSEDTDSSSDEDPEAAAARRRTPAPAPRIKLITNKTPNKTPIKTPKPVNRPPRPAVPTPDAFSAAVAANAAALLNPPPENAVVGSPDAPWLRLTEYEMARLRKRMKKNATWTPSETMVARELKVLDRGPDSYREAKKKAEDEGKIFDPTVPAPEIDETGTSQMPAGAISVDSVAAEEVPTSNRGMKLNEAKKLKREALAKQAAEDAEESARQMEAAAKLFLGAEKGSSENATEGKARTSTRANTKRKREADEEDGSEEVNETKTAAPSRPNAKRTKTETPVPPPPPQRRRPSNGNTNGSDTSKRSQHLTPGSANVTPQSETPVPLPRPRQGSSISRSVHSPTPNPPGSGTSAVPTKPPAETPVPLPRSERYGAEEGTRRQTRGNAAKLSQQQLQQTKSSSPAATAVPSDEQVPIIKRSSSRGGTPRMTPVPDGPSSRRPGSRGKAMSQEPQTSVAVDRTRRASTARSTPGPPEAKQQPSKRSKRPAPGIVSTTNSGGNTAVGKRKAAPKKKARTTRREKSGALETEMEEVDDEGKPIDPNEPRYCMCNRVSFGTMIQCDNVDGCKQEWFHLECVGLSDIPARTTKWYCPDCRKALNIGAKGEVSARGVRK